MSAILPKIDVAVIGGGPAGLATALRLADSPAVSVAVLERAERPIPKIGETVPPRIRPVLEALGAWDSFLDGGHLPGWGTSSCWGSSEIGYNDFLFHPEGSGWHLDRTRFEEHLEHAAAARGAHVMRGVSVRGASDRSGGWRLVLRTQGGEQTLDAAVVVDASGRQSTFARRQGARRRDFDTLVGAFRFFERPGSSSLPTGLTLVEAAEHGWWYSAAVPRDQIVACFMTDADILQGLLLGDEAAWNKHSAGSRHTAARLQDAVPLGPVQVKPAFSSLLDPLVGRRWLAVGDAATSFDPLSSQGILKALLSGIQAADAIRGALAGDDGALARYAREQSALMESYLKAREQYYSAETRWPGALFWRRRSSSG